MEQNSRALIESWEREEQEPFTGWDFSYLKERMLEEHEPWSYDSRAAELMHGAESVLDIDTGGGERMLNLRPHWPKKVVVTEHYTPNFRLATERMAPLGVRVIDTPSGDFDPLPFADGEFDLVLNRHGSFNSGEIARILAPGGTFLTQQIHGMWGHDLQAVFGAKPQWPDSTPAKYVPLLKVAGMTIVDLREWEGKFAFTDVGAIVYYLKAVPWEVPGFSVRKNQKELLVLQERLNQGEDLAFWAGKYLIEARKPV